MNCNSTTLKLLAFILWPLVGVCLLALVAIFIVLAWPGLLLVPMRLVDGELKVGGEQP